MDRTKTGDALNNVIDMKSVRGLAMVPAVKNYNQQAVDLLEELLIRAKAGEVLELVVVARLPSGDYEHSYTGCENLMDLAGVLARMQYRTQQRMDT